MMVLLYVLGALLFAWPKKARTFFAHVLGDLWFFVLRYRRATVLANVRQAFPQLEERERRRLARRAFRHLVLVLFEFLCLPHEQRIGLRDFAEDTKNSPHIVTRPLGLCRMNGLENFRAAHAKGKGVLLLTGHLGSWEYALCEATGHIGPVHVVVKRLPKWLDRFAGRVRTGSGAQVLLANGALKGMLRALKANETVAFVLDQNATRSQGVFVDFFGLSASTYAGLAVVACRTGAPVVPAIPHREVDGSHALTFYPEIHLESRSTPAETALLMTQKYTHVLEDAIRRHPEQWFWTHRRWKTRPRPAESPGEPGSTPR